MGKYILALELDDSNLKLLECKKQKTSLMINRARIIPLPEGLIVDGTIYNTDEVYALIYREIKERKYKAKDIVVVIKSSQVIRRNIKMDLMPQKDLEAILALQYQKHLLVDIEAYQVGYKKIEKIWTAHEKDQDLLLVAVPNKMIDPIIQIVSKLKMKVQGINISSDAISNFFIKEEDAILIDIASNVTGVTIISGGYGVLNRVIPFGANSVEALLIEAIGSQIEKLLHFYGSRYPSNPIDKIHIIGKTDYFNAIEKQMISVFGISCQLGISLSLDEFKGLSDLAYKEDDFIHILGMISEFWSKDPKQINLLPVKYKRHLKRRRYIIPGLAATSLLVVGLSFLAYLPSYKIKTMQKEKKDLEATLKQDLFLEVKKIIKDTSTGQKEERFVRKSLEEIRVSSHISKKTIDIIISNAPGGITINDIKMDGILEIVAIRGKAPNLTSIAQYMVSLNNTKQFQELSYTSNQNKEMEIDYHIEIQLKTLQDEKVVSFESDDELDEAGGQDDLDF